MFHIGHLNLLTRVKGLGDRLIVGVSTDEFNTLKGKRTLIPFAQRVEIVKAIRGVDLVIPETDWEQKPRDIQKYKVNVFAMGNDWAGKFDHLKERCEVVYLERTDGISTTELKQSLKNFLSVSKDDVLKAFEILDALRKDLE
jgi:glycerol-3-phosphate cytidylyltransferase